MIYSRPNTQTITPPANNAKMYARGAQIAAKIRNASIDIIRYAVAKIASIPSIFKVSNVSINIVYTFMSRGNRYE